MDQNDSANMPFAMQSYFTVPLTFYTFKEAIPSHLLEMLQLRLSIINKNLSILIISFVFYKKHYQGNTCNSIPNVSNADVFTSDTKMFLIRYVHFQVDGTLSIIPDEYKMNSKTADIAHTESDILNFDIDRRRGSSMVIGTVQTARKEIKQTQVTSEQENMIRKSVEIGFLLNEPAVTTTISKFILDDRAGDRFRNLGIQQRSRETGRVLLNQLFTQDYKPSEIRQKFDIEGQMESDCDFTLSDVVIE